MDKAVRIAERIVGILFRQHRMARGVKDAFARIEVAADACARQISTMSSQNRNSPSVSMMQVRNARHEEVVADYLPASDIVSVNSAMIWDAADEVEWDYHAGT